MAVSSDWQNDTFFQRALYVLNEKKWSDCSFLLGSCEVKEIYAHKMFLAMSSPVFETMFYGSLPENNFRIPINDINPEAFEMLLQYIYTESIVLDTLDEAINVHYAAKKYIIPGLVKLCIDRMWDFLTPKTACNIYEFAKIYEDTELEDQCLKIISAFTVEVLEDSSFLSIKLSTLEKILDMDDLSVPSELALFNALLVWAESECQRINDQSKLRSVVNTTLSKVRFLTLKPQDITEGVARTNLLTELENYAILTNIISPDSTNVSMPSDFSLSRTTRSGQARQKTSDKYLWIPKFEITGGKNGIFSITNIVFEVSKKLKIVGVQMAPSQSTLPKNIFSMNEVEADAVVGMEIGIDDGKPIFTSYFHQANIKTSSQIKFNEFVYLERSNVYVFRVIIYYPPSYPLISNTAAISNLRTPALPPSASSVFGGYGNSFSTSFGAPTRVTFPVNTGKTPSTLQQTAPLISEQTHFVFQEEDTIILKIMFNM